MGEAEKEGSIMATEQKTSPGNVLLELFGTIVALVIIVGFGYGFVRFVRWAWETSIF